MLLTAPDEAATFALEHEGAAYAYGGIGPAAFDCSGLASAAWADAGVKIPRTTQGQAALPAVEHPEPGDIAIFDLGGGADHVGVMVGGSSMVHAGSKGVVEADIEAAFWQRHLVKFVRPAEGNRLPELRRTNEGAWRG